MLGNPYKMIPAITNQGKRKSVESNNNKVQFLASFPPIQSAIKIGQDGMRIQLDIPETEVENAIALIALRDVVLRVTVEIGDVQVIGGRSES